MELCKIKTKCFNYCMTSETNSDKEVVHAEREPSVDMSAACLLYLIQNRVGVKESIFVNWSQSNASGAKISDEPGLLEEIINVANEGPNTDVDEDRVRAWFGVLKYNAGASFISIEQARGLGKRVGVLIDYLQDRGVGAERELATLNEENIGPTLRNEILKATPSYGISPSQSEQISSLV